MRCVTILKAANASPVAIWEHGPVEKSDFTFGVSELRQAEQPRRPIAITPASIQMVDRRRLKVIDDKQGFDPYNSSGSFDRSRAWERVGKQR